MPGGVPILVGVPVWRAAEFVAETLSSILRQEGVDFRVVIAIDGDDVGSEEACRPFLADPRVRLIVHPDRLGWVRNSAYVFGLAVTDRAEYACIQPHDDIMEPGYLAALSAQAASRPSASVVYSDMAIVASETIIKIPQVVGTPVERQLSMLRMHFAAAAYRGLTRVSAIARVPALSGNPVGDFGADTVWCARMATVGELVRVERPLYTKRYHEQNTHGAWRKWGTEQRLAAWKRHCLDMLAEALTVAQTADQKIALAHAAIQRFLQSTPPSSPYKREMAALDPATRQRLFAEFDRAAAEIAKGVLRRA